MKMENPNKSREPTEMQLSMKRKNESEEETNLISKKPHNETEFSETQIAAESTHIENSIDMSHSTNQIIESLANISEFGNDISSSSLADTVVETCIKEVEANNSIKELVIYLQRELKEKDDLISILSSESSKLKKEVNKLEKKQTDIMVNLSEKTVQLKKQQVAILKLNSLANLKTSKEIGMVEARTKDSQPDKNDEKSGHQKGKSKRRCKYENRGYCKDKSRCNYFHPSKICHSHSKYGTCHNYADCKFRHPLGICHTWNENDTCERGYSCRFRHPVKKSQRDFLGKMKQQKTQLPMERQPPSSLSQNLSQPLPMFPFPPPPIHQIPMLMQQQYLQQIAELPNLNQHPTLKMNPLQSLQHSHQRTTKTQ